MNIVNTIAALYPDRNNRMASLWRCAIGSLLLAICACFAVATAQVVPFGPSVLVAHFDDKTNGAPIGTGGAALGEPVHVPSNLSAIVTQISPGDQVLRLTRTSGTTSARARFELLDGMEVTEGVVRIRLTLSSLGPYSVLVRESGGSTQSFLTLSLTSAGFFANDAAGAIPTNPLSLQAGEPHRLELRFDMDAGTHQTTVNGQVLYTDRAHGITARGIGRVIVGHDANNYTHGIDLDSVRVMLDGPLPDRILDAHFDEHPLGPIGVGGAEVGEPVFIGQTLTADVVEAGGVGNRALEVEGHSGEESVQAMWWEALDGFEVETGVVEISARIRFDVLDRYVVLVRESSGSVPPFLSLNLDSLGNITATTAGGSGAIGTYAAGVPYRLRLGFDMDAGTVEVALNDDILLPPTPHGVTDHGVGRFIIGANGLSQTGSQFLLDDLVIDTDAAGPVMPPEVFADGFEGENN